MNKSKKSNKSQKDIEYSLRFLAKTSIIVLFAIFLSKIFTYLYRIVVARYFGPEIYGLFSFSILIISILIIFSSFGLSDGVLRYISYYRGKKDNKKISLIIKICLFSSSVFSIFLAIILFLFSDQISIFFFHNSSLTPFLKILSITLPLTVITNVLLAIIRAFEKIAVYSIFINIAQNFLRVLILGIFVFLGINYLSIPFSYLVAALIMVIAPYYYIKIYLSKNLVKTPSFNFSLFKQNYVKELFSYSWPIMFLGAITSIFYWTDTFMISYYLDARSVGIYNVALPIVALLGIAPDLFMQLFFPLITKEYSKKNLSLVSEISKQVGKWIIILNLPIFFAMVLFPGVIVNILFGPQYFEAIMPIRFLAIGGLLTSLTALSSSLISSIGKTKIILSNIIFCSLLNVALNYILIPTYGLVGASIATMISFAVLSIILIIESYYLNSIIPLRRKSLRIILISFIPMLLLYFIKDKIEVNVFILIIFATIFLLLYVLLIILTKSLDKNDIMILKSIKNKIIFSKS